VDIDGAFKKAEAFLRKHIKSKAVRAAEKRRSERKMQDFGRRFGRAAAAASTSGVGIAGYSVAVAPLAGPALLAAGAAALLVTAAAFHWRPLFGRREFSREELLALPGKAEEWLLEKRPDLPVRAAPALDALLVQLADLEPQLKRLDPLSTLAWDARRLIGNHLPRLIEGYCELPATIRERDPSYENQLIKGMETLADELLDLCRQVSRDRLVTFEAHGKFLESRYKDSDVNRR